MTMGENLSAAITTIKSSCPPAPALQGLYSCSAGTHPGGSVLGCGGYLAAQAVAKDLDIQMSSILVSENAG